MKKYRLKKGQESFQVVDGPYAGKKFEKGRTYTDIPPEESRRFEAKPVVSEKSRGTKPVAEIDKKE